MRMITKGPEPSSLTEHRDTDHSDYDNYADKGALRDALVTEQRGICCYCMGRIHSDPKTMKIEHWQARSCYPARQLDYRNLLGACLGGEGLPQRRQHCDTRKGAQDLLWNPADPGHRIETRLRYEADGSIRSDDTGFDAQLEEVLNLNLVLLKNRRKRILDGILEWWQHQRSISRPRIERERDRWLAGNGELTPYCQVAVWWLEQRLANLPP